MFKLSELRRFARRKTLILVIALALVSLIVLLLSVPKTKDDWPAVKQMVRSSFPSVRQMSTAELADRLTHNESERPLLLDTRSDDEYAVSHLLSAQPAVSEGQALDALKDVSKEKLIVVYCSVGYRSSAMADRLAAHGYTNVYNLEGSIFEWANEGRPVYRGDRQVTQVHPYDSTWGGLLDRGMWCNAPDQCE